MHKTKQENLLKYKKSFSRNKKLSRKAQMDDWDNYVPKTKNCIHGRPDHAYKRIRFF